MSHSGVRQSLQQWQYPKRHTVALGFAAGELRSCRSANQSIGMQMLATLLEKTLGERWIGTEARIFLGADPEIGLVFHRADRARYGGRQIEPAGLLVFAQAEAVTPADIEVCEALCHGLPSGRAIRKTRRLATILASARQNRQGRAAGAALSRRWPLSGRSTSCVCSACASAGHSDRQRRGDSPRGHPAGPRSADRRAPWL